MWVRFSFSLIRGWLLSLSFSKGDRTNDNAYRINSRLLDTPAKTTNHADDELKKLLEVNSSPAASGILPHHPRGQR